MAEEKKNGPKQPEKEPIKFLGKECTKYVTSKGVVCVNMRTGDYKEILEKEGITDDVTKAVTKGLQNITSQAVKEAKDLCKKNKGAVVEVNLGGGGCPFSQEIKFIGRKESHRHNPQTKEAFTAIEYGVVTATLNMPWGSQMKGEDGELAKYAKEMDDFFNRKK